MLQSARTKQKVRQEHDPDGNPANYSQPPGSTEEASVERDLFGLPLALIGQLVLLRKDLLPHERRCASQAQVGRRPSARGDGKVVRGGAAHERRTEGSILGFAAEVALELRSHWPRGEALSIRSLESRRITRAVLRESCWKRA